MSEFDLSLPKDFDGRVRLFPLATVVLFPSIIQGLHIFEPRYRAMTAAALEGDGLLTIGMPVTFEASGKPPELFPVVCIGRIVSHALLDDGRYNLLLLGLRRARLVDEFPASAGQLWRAAKVEVIRERIPRDKHRIEKARRELLASFEKYTSSAGKDQSPFSSIEPESVPLGILCDTLAHMAGLGIQEQLMVLEEASVLARSELVAKFLQNKSVCDGADSSRAASFPPRFSDN